MAFPTDWLYRKSITLSRASGAVTNYQMKLLVGESAGSGTNDVLATGCKTDFSDLRFTDADGTTLLDYWIESVSGTTPDQVATVWVEFDSIGTGATTFYMYYGNAGASAVSNGVNTFIAFHDFNALETANLTGQDSWTGDTGQAVQESVVAEGAKAVIGTGNADCNHAFTNTGWNIFMEAKVRCSSSGAQTGDTLVFLSQTDLWGITGVGLRDGSARMRMMAGSGWEDLLAGTSADTWYLGRVEMTAANKVKGYVNGINYGGEQDAHAAVTGDINVIGLESWGLSSGKASYFDCIKVGKFLVVAPALGSWGSEESLGGGEEGGGGGSIMNSQFFVMLLAGGGR